MPGTYLKLQDQLVRLVAQSGVGAITFNKQLLQVKSVEFKTTVIGKPEEFIANGFAPDETREARASLTALAREIEGKCKQMTTASGTFA